jgi:Domain of unknown function (DUF4189)
MMHPHPSRRGPIVARAVVVTALFSAAATATGLAAGALAVALPPDVAKGGFSYGYANDKSDDDAASTRALELCRTTKDASTDPKLRNLCKVILNYSDKCVAVAMDPAAGTPGVGWAVALDKRSAEHDALIKCEATAGAGRAAACQISHSDCDGSAQ